MQLNFLWMPALGLLLGLSACAPSAKTTQQESMASSQLFDWQGHRGARGLRPENTVPAFLKALEYPVRTLELDVVISRDSQVIVSHEPWFSHEICRHPDGRPVTETEEDELLILQMNLTEIRQYDCGSRGNQRFPGQQPMAVTKPTLREMVEAVEGYCRTRQRELPHYNIEIKSRPEWDGVRTPAPETFVRLVLADIDSLGIAGRVCIQSFDKRSLQVVHRLRPELTLALLIENADGVAANLKDLGFTPAVYSPYYRMVAAGVVDSVHEQGMKIIPWTVNDTADMRTLIDMGVDGIITDYPDRALEVHGP